MNQKHLALILVGICALAIVQGILWLQGETVKITKKAETARHELESQREMAEIGLLRYRSLQNSSGDLMKFLSAWEAVLAEVPTRDSAEAQFITRIRDANLATISQRFDTVPVKGGSSIPEALRAHVIFEDNFVRLLNWLGTMEREMPGLRVSSLRISRGTRPEDIRMEASLDQPIFKK
jgi:hypothetical protein